MTWDVVFFNVVIKLVGIALENGMVYGIQDFQFTDNLVFCGFRSCGRIFAMLVLVVCVPECVPVGNDVVQNISRP